MPEAFFIKYQVVENCHEKNTEFRSSYDSKTCIFGTIMPDLVTVRKNAKEERFRRYAILSVITRSAN